MPPVLLDTHVLVWWQSKPARLSKVQAQVLQELERRRQPAAISAVTLRELATMVERGRHDPGVPLDLWLEEIENDPMLTVLPLTAKIAAESVQLGADFPKDPADQIIVATARCHGLRLMTADENIRRWGKVSLI
ncbi:MAG: type II toxin-antitoxin system VapC family toxin [Acidobacteria bacterium]|nr:type II toxin-antitoxin system VapC family toxin [Acidobacteriota bacterium]